ncbi:MAG: FAD:protein FMN transferase [Verrucomicrobiota bacterium]|nr:FAD:protein FMN transferase [Limisphaera sp.]MDW8382458.1 FAD:protein FMN transferase [Verrucomicrobiota bacterium]
MENDFKEPVESVRLAVEAMATRFELLLYGASVPALRAAAEEALAEVQRLEARLSLFRPDSEIARINARAAREPVRVLPEVWNLLEHALALTEATDGAFDITVGPLLACWGFRGGYEGRPTPEALEQARACVGPQLLTLDRARWSVRFRRPGVIVDLGGIGKGYAIEQAVQVLREAGVTCGLIHGGTSTAYALGQPPDAPAWQVAIEPPPPLRTAGVEPLAVVSLRDEALSVSAVWGRAWTDAEGVYGHVIDPRTGQPASDAVLAAVIAESATEADALSTALLVLGEPGMELLRRRWPRLRALVLRHGQSRWHLASCGLSLRPPKWTVEEDAAKATPLSKFERRSP